MKNIFSDKGLVYTIVFICSVLMCVATIGYRGYIQYTLYMQTQGLIQIDHYDTSTLIPGGQGEVHSFQKITDILGYNTSIINDITKFEKYRETLGKPYTYMMHHIYTPSLNIRADPYTHEIKTNLLGEAYIKANPFGDIRLIEQWTTFFKDMGSADIYNTISDITVGKIQPAKNGFFSIPITVQFETQDRRGFLLLANKLSMTSYTENISLINEFMYYLRNTIATDKKDIIATAMSGKNMTGITTIDEYIGQNLYTWIHTPKAETPLIDKAIIDKTIALAAGCQKDDPAKCLYLFRDKFRGLPYLAYTVGKGDGAGVISLKKFLASIPPILRIKSFSFDEKKGNENKKKHGPVSFKGSISMDMYGRDVSDTERDSIAAAIGAKCFVPSTPMSVALATSKTQGLIDTLSKTDDINTKRSVQLNEILDQFAKLEKDYPTYTNQKKVIRLFEVYRMLDAAALCDT